MYVYALTGDSLFYSGPVMFVNLFKFGRICTRSKTNARVIVIYRTDILEHGSAHTQNSHQHTKKQTTYEYYICFIDFVSECIDFVFPPANEIILAIFHTFVNIRICKHQIRKSVAFVVGDDDCCAFSNVIQYTHIR